MAAKKKVEKVIITGAYFTHLEAAASLLDRIFDSDGKQMVVDPSDFKKFMQINKAAEKIDSTHEKYNA